jgi:hypothetical protein
VTPHIIENPREADAIFEEKKEQIEEVKGGTIKMYEKPAREKEAKDVKSEPEGTEAETLDGEKLEGEKTEGEEIEGESS